jgi:DNA-binding transcriptional LysR family regulator
MNDPNGIISPMQFEALKVFCDIARLRSFSEAATANVLSQSAASHIVAQLEKRLGQLIVRHPRPLRLTPLGQQFYEGCNALVEQYLDLEASILKARTEMSGRVRVAAIYSVGLGDMGQYLTRFKTVEPNADVHVEYLHPDQVYEKVREGTIDFGLVSFPKPARGLIVTPWRDEIMIVVCSPNDPFARLKAVRPQQLEGAKYIHFERGLVIRNEIERFLRDHGVKVKEEAAFDNTQTIKQAVSDGLGIALLPEPTVRREVQAGVLMAVPLQGCRFVRPLGIVRGKRHKLGPVAQRFLDFLRQNGLDNGHTSETPHEGGPKNGRKKARKAV